MRILAPDCTNLSSVFWICSVDLTCSNHYKIILMVSNPVEAMTYVAWKLSGFPAERVIGAGTTPDSARFKMLLASKTLEPVESITGMVLGGSGEYVTPIWSSVTICGGRSNEKLKAILEDFPEKCRLRGKRTVNLYTPPQGAQRTKISSILISLFVSTYKHFFRVFAKAKSLIKPIFI